MSPPPAPDAGGWKLYTKGTSATADANTPFEVSYDGVVATSNKEMDKVIFQKEPSNDSELMVFFSNQLAKHPVVWEVISRASARPQREAMPSSSPTPPSKAFPTKLS